MIAESGNAGGGDPLPAGDEARTGELPEHLVREKGQSGDAEAAVRPAPDPVTPDGESYEIGSGQAAPRDQAESPIVDLHRG